MRFFLLILCLVSLAASAKPAPDFSINASELPATLSALKGKVVYLDFWASWCKPCRASFPFMNSLQQQHKDAGLVVIAVNLDENRSDAAQFLDQTPANFAIHYDPNGEIAKQYALLGMPSSYLIDRQGQIRARHQGFFNEKSSQYQAQVQQLLSEAP